MRIPILILSLSFALFGCATTTPESEFRDSIAEKIEDQKPRFRECYVKMPEPRKTGTVKTEFIFDPSGKVTKTSVNVKESTLADPALEECVLSVLRSIRFNPLKVKPGSKKPETFWVGYPFKFQ